MIGIIFLATGVASLFYSSVTLWNMMALTLTLVGSTLVLRDLSRKVQSRGLSFYLPHSWQYLLCDADVLEIAVKFIKQSSYFDFLARIFVVRTFSLSRWENEMLLKGVWSGFSGRRGLLSLLPNWVGDKYYPSAVTVPSEHMSPLHLSPCRKMDSVDIQRSLTDGRDPNTLGNRDSASGSASATVLASNNSGETHGRANEMKLPQLLLLVLEKRIRAQMNRQAPVIKRRLLNVVCVLFLVYVITRRPSVRRYLNRIHFPYILWGAVVAYLFLINGTDAVTGEPTSALQTAGGKLLGLMRPPSDDITGRTRATGSVSGVMHAILDPFLPVRFRAAPLTTAASVLDQRTSATGSATVKAAHRSVSVDTTVPAATEVGDQTSLGSRPCSPAANL